MSAENNILSYLEKYKDAWHSSGGLQRMEWRNNDGTIAVPRTIVRRLQEMENEKKIAVQHQGKKNTAEYRFIPLDWRTKYVTLKEREEKNLTMWGKPIPSTFSYVPPLAYKD